MAATKNNKPVVLLCGVVVAATAATYLLLSRKKKKDKKDSPKRGAIADSSTEKDVTPSSTDPAVHRDPGQASSKVSSESAMTRTKLPDSNEVVSKDEATNPSPTKEEDAAAPETDDDDKEVVQMEESPPSPVKGEQVKSINKVDEKEEPVPSPTKSVAISDKMEIFQKKELAPFEAEVEAEDGVGEQDDAAPSSAETDAATESVHVNVEVVLPKEDFLVPSPAKPDADAAEPIHETVPVERASKAPSPVEVVVGHDVESEDKGSVLSPENTETATAAAVAVAVASPITQEVVAVSEKHAEHEDPEAQRTDNDDAALGERIHSDENEEATSPAPTAASPKKNKRNRNRKKKGITTATTTAPVGASSSNSTTPIHTAPDTPDDTENKNTAPITTLPKKPKRNRNRKKKGIATATTAAPVGASSSNITTPIRPAPDTADANENKNTANTGPITQSSKTEIDAVASAATTAAKNALKNKRKKNNRKKKGTAQTAAAKELQDFQKSQGGKK